MNPSIVAMVPKSVAIAYRTHFRQYHSHTNVRLNIHEFNYYNIQRIYSTNLHYKPAGLNSDQTEDDIDN